MFRRKLLALDHISPENFNINDEAKVRALVLWLENQKIRHYKIEDRENLMKIDSPVWDQAFKTYLQDVACPFQDGALAEQIEWLLGYAVKMEYSDDIDKYKGQTMENIKKGQCNTPKVISSNPLDNLDFESEDFKRGVNALARIMKVTSHPDHLVTLQAVSSVVCDRLNSEVVQNPDIIIPKGKPFPVLEADLGFDMGDKVSNEAAKILRLLYIQDLRRLQTQINECIVSVQKVTANPKTDTKLGKVGY